MNAIVDPIPDDVDVILCREVLFHLSLGHAERVVSKIINSNASHLIATHINLNKPNKNTYTGGYRPLDLMRPPFDLKKPSFLISDDAVSEHRQLGVWSLRQRT